MVTIDKLGPSLNEQWNLVGKKMTSTKEQIDKLLVELSELSKYKQDIEEQINIMEGKQ